MELAYYLVKEHGCNYRALRHPNRIWKLITGPSPKSYFKTAVSEQVVDEAGCVFFQFEVFRSAYDCFVGYGIIDS